MGTDQTRKAIVRPEARDCIRRCSKWFIGLITIALALALAGCGKPVPPYWPDLVVDDGGADGSILYVAETSGQVFALRANSGDVVWSYPIVERKSGGLLGGCSGPVATDGPFYAAPAFNDEYLFLGSAGEQQRSIWGKGENRAGLRVLNKLGAPQWEFRGARDRTVVSPLLDENTVYLPSSDNHVYAIDLNTQQVRWAFETGNWVWATPLIVKDLVYIASMDHILYAIDNESGAQVWRFDQSPSALPATPAFAEDLLYFGSLDGHVYAVQAQTGALQWQYKVDGGVWATPLIREDAKRGTSALYFGTLSGKLYALSVKDGTELWQESVGGEVRGTPAYVNGILYFGCENGRLYAIDADNGTQKASLLGQQLERASIYTSPMYDGRQLYVVATDGQIFALDPEKNAILWQANPLGTKD